MPTWPEFATAMYGCFRLLRGDKSALAFFDQTLRGFWLSFSAAVFCLLPHLWLVTAEADLNAVEIGGHFYISKVLLYAVSWLAFPVVILHITDMLGRRDRFFDYMVPYNWMSVPLNYLVMTISVGEVVGILPSAIAGLAFFAAFGLALWVLWTIAKTALDITGRQAAALVAFDFVFNHFLTEILSRVSG